ncbi:MAG: hypothetical protein JSW71_03945 [Gemmatimonadota bacterium]|nr:MAG: hypothetical protein JSW71_03945 [Gemmatimonadota bacterium]
MQPDRMLTRLIWTSRRPVALAAAFALLACACSAGSGWSRHIEPELAIEGDYEWLDAYERQTGCLVGISTRGDKYHGWVVDDPEQSRECPWYGFELREFEVRGFEVRLIIQHPHGRNTYGWSWTGEYLLNLVPRLSMKGRLIGGRSRAGNLRWREITLVYLR